MATIAFDTLSLQQTYHVLNWTKNLSPVIIFVLFLSLYVTWSIINSPDDGDKVTVHSMRGPGGRPLPTRRKSNQKIKEAFAVRDISPRAKAAFAVLTICIILTYVINGGVVITEVLSRRDEDWWPGKNAIVSRSNG